MEGRVAGGAGEIARYLCAAILVRTQYTHEPASSKTRKTTKSGVSNAISVARGIHSPGCERSNRFHQTVPGEVYNQQARLGNPRLQILFQYKVVKVRKGFASGIMSGRFRDESHYRQFRSPRRVDLVCGFL